MHRGWLGFGRATQKTLAAFSAQAKSGSNSTQNPFSAELSMTLRFAQSG
jgi:hypothetical protein